MELYRLQVGKVSIYREVQVILGILKNASKKKKNFWTFSPQRLLLLLRVVLKMQKKRLAVFEKLKNLSVEGVSAAV